jgi:hypothetical protein
MVKSWMLVALALSLVHLLITLIFISKGNNSSKTRAPTLDGKHVLINKTSANVFHFHDSVVESEGTEGSARFKVTVSQKSSVGLQNGIEIIQEAIVKPNHESNKTIYVCGYPHGGLGEASLSGLRARCYPGPPYPAVEF